MDTDFHSILRAYSRYILIIFNIFFVTTGIIIASVGISVKTYYHEYNVFVEDKYLYASDFLIIIGAIIFVIAFFGCCGALKESACMTLTFSSLLIIILLLEIFIGIGGIILKNRTESMIDKAFNETIIIYKQNNNTEVNLLWDQIQNQFNCCGILNYTDWKNATTTSNYLPISCCSIPPGQIYNFTCTENNCHKEGCLRTFTNYIEGHAISIQSAGLTLALIQLFGIIFSCYLTKQIRSDYETV